MKAIDLGWLSWYTRASAINVEGAVTLDQYLTVREVSERTGVSGARVRYLAGQGRFPGAVKPARDWFLPAASVEKWLKEDRDRRRKESNNGGQDQSIPATGTA